MKFIKQFATVTFVAGAFGAMLGVSPIDPAQSLRDWAVSLVPERVIEKEVTVDKQERSVEELVQEIPPKYGISPLLMAAIIDRESGGKKDAIRYEPAQMAKARKLTKNDSTAMALASSHGLAQVMGYWAKDYGISWTDLYNPETNIEVACAILKKGIDRHGGKGKYEAIRAGLAEYNGSYTYADEILSYVGHRLIEKNL